VINKMLRTLGACGYLAAVACGSTDGTESSSSAPSSANAGSSPTLASHVIAASVKTTSETGIVTWEFSNESTHYYVVGRDGHMTVLANFDMVYDPNACTKGSGSPLETTSIAPAVGRQSLSCAGEPVESTFDAATQAIWDNLSTDLSARMPGAAESATKPDFTCPAYQCGCEMKTSTHCAGVLEVCQDQHYDCSKSNWYPCGVCLGFW
jgi:hypothetical protein